MKFLFYFTDIGTRGITRWLRLVTSYERGLSPFVGLLDLEGATIDALVSQLGIALEAVGYQALIEAGRTPTAANNAATSAITIDAADPGPSPEGLSEPIIVL